jgi:hypothetical protein
MTHLTEEQFYEKYELIENHLEDNASFDGCLFETYGDELLVVQQMAKENRVITIIEGDEETENNFGEPTLNMYYVSGMHLVNRIGYLITKEPIKEEFQVKLD